MLWSEYQVDRVHIAIHWVRREEVMSLRLTIYCPHFVFPRSCVLLSLFSYVFLRNGKIPKICFLACVRAWERPNIKWVHHRM